LSSSLFESGPGHCFRCYTVKEKYNLYLSGLIILCIAAAVAVVVGLKWILLDRQQGNYDDANKSENQQNEVNYVDRGISDDDKKNNDNTAGVTTTQAADMERLQLQFRGMLAAMDNDRV
jgi:hypothetical protein